jgi:hypothetical protein
MYPHVMNTIKMKDKIQEEKEEEKNE